MQHCSIFFLNVFCKPTSSLPSVLNPEHCAAGLPHGFSSDPWFYLIDLRLNILEIIGFTEKIWRRCSRIGDNCCIFSFSWVDIILGLSINSIKEEDFSSHRQVGADFYRDFFRATRHESSLKSLKLQRPSLMPHSRSPLWKVSHHWANMYKIDLTGRTVYN